MKESEACNLQPCHKPVDCQWSQWGRWSGCTKECGGGQMERKRYIEVEPRHGGKACKFQASVEVHACNEGSCGKEYCAWAPWGEWTGCSATCDTGTQHRARILKKARATSMQLTSMMQENQALQGKVAK